MKYRFFLLFLLTSFSSTTPSIIIQGDEQAAAGTTFSFPILKHAASSETIFYGARDAGAKEWALSRLPLYGTNASALAQASATVNFVQDQNNPLYDKGIALLDIITTPVSTFNTMDRAVVVATDANLAPYIFFVDQLTKNHPLSVIVAGPLKDAQGATTSGIVALTTASTGRAGAFAAVKPNSGSLGNTGTGIALISALEVKVTINDKEQTQVLFIQVPSNELSAQLQSTPFDRTSSFLKIGSDLASIAAIDMHWDSLMQRLFVVIQATGSAGATDGLKAVAVGRIVNGKLIFQPIAPDSIFDVNNKDEIIGAQGSSAQVSLHAVRTMHTSLGLDYLIVLGGNQNLTDTKRVVHALPLVNTFNSSYAITDELTHGTLAKKDGTPLASFKNDNPATFQFRKITEPAQTRSDIITAVETEGLVGGGPLTDDIQEIYCVKGMVFAVVPGQQLSNVSTGGIFYSQALFDSLGRIKAWTPWQNALKFEQRIFGMNYARKLGDIIFMTGQNESTINTLARTTWSAGADSYSKPLGEFLMQQFPKNIGGVQGFFDFGQNTPGLGTITTYIATGFKKITLIESSYQDTGNYIPNRGDFVKNFQSFDAGVITETPSSKILVISGGALDDIGPIIASEIGVAEINYEFGSSGFLFVGGNGGLAVLCDDSGLGWHVPPGLEQNFAGIMPGFAFRKLGNYSSVRKLIADGNFLYILTDSRLDRIDMRTSHFATNSLDITTLATLGDPVVFAGNGTFLDFLISDKFAILATSSGLFRAGNGTDATTAQSPSHMRWTTVAVNESAGSVTQLYALTQSGRSQDFARESGGNVYALNGFTGKNVAQVNRFAVENIEDGITDTSLQAIPDILVQGSPSYFKNFGGYANQFASDGALFLYSRSRNLGKNPFVKSIQALLSRDDILLPLSYGDSNAIVNIHRSSALGNWMIIGDRAYFNE